MLRHILHNQVETAGNWIGVKLIEEGHGVSPLGATVTAAAGARTWIARMVTGDSFTAQHAHTAHFGLGKVEKVDEIAVRWRDGKTVRIENPELGTYHPVRGRDSP